MAALMGVIQFGDDASDDGDDKIYHAKNDLQNT